MGIIATKAVVVTVETIAKIYITIYIILCLTTSKYKTIIKAEIYKYDTIDELPTVKRKPALKSLVKNALKQKTTMTLKMKRIKTHLR